MTSSSSRCVDALDCREIRLSIDEPERFSGVFERHVSDIFRFHSVRVGIHRAEDCTAETFLAAFRNRVTYQPSRGTCRAWLFGIAANVARREARGIARQGHAIERLQGRRDLALSATEVGFDQVLDGDLIGHALASIEVELRDVVVLVGGIGLTYEETASALQIPIGTVRSRLSRARRRLRTSFGHTRTADPASEVVD